MSFIARNSRQGWRILQLDRNTKIDTAEALFRDFDSHITGGLSNSPLGRPLLTEPTDNALLPLPVSRHPTLAWTFRGGSPVAFLVELQMNVMHTDAPPPIDPRDLTDSFLQFVPVSPGQMSYQISAPFGVNAQPYRARIWALDAAGNVALSDWHAMYFSFTQPSGATMGPIDRHRDRFGGDFRDFAIPSAEACYNRCAADPKCRAFSFATDTRHCWLKDRITNPSDSPTLDSGIKIVK